MRAGRLRHRVEIQSLMTTQDGYGEPVESWTTVDTVWSEVTPLMTATREAFVAQADRRVARQTLQVRIRFREGLSPSSTRLVWENKVLNVESVMDPDGHKRELVLLCAVVE